MKIYPLQKTTEPEQDPFASIDPGEIDFPVKTSPLENSYKNMMGVEPDKVAQVIKLSKDLDQPEDMVAANLSEATQAAAVPSRQYFADIEKRFPSTSKFLQNSRAMAVAKDDIDTLTKTEQHTKDYAFGDELRTAMRAAFAATNPIYAASSGVRYAASHIPGAAGFAGRNLSAGFARLNEQMTQVPSAIYDVGALPINAALKMGGLGDHQIETPDWIRFESSAKYWEDYAKSTQTPEAERSVIDAARSGDFQKAAKILAAQVIVNAPYQAALLAGAVAGANVPALAAAGILQGADTARRGRLMGADPTMSTLNAITQGVAEAGFERMGTFGLLRRWEGTIARAISKDSAKQVMKDLAKTLAYSFLGEGSEEGATQFVQSLSDYSTGVNPSAIDGVGIQMLDAFLVGGFSGLSMTGPSAILSGVSRANMVNQVETAKRTYLAMGESAEASKLRQRLPEAHKAFIEAATKGTPTENVYIPVEAFDTYFQSQNIDPQQMARELNVIDQLASARESGGDLKIPMNEWTDTIVGTEHWNGLADDVKFNAEMLTVRQTNELNARVDRMVTSEAQAAAASDPAVAQGLQFIHDDILQKMSESGAFEKMKDGAQIMEANAQLFAAMVVNEARRMGQDPSAYYLGGKPIEFVTGQAVPAEALQQAGRSPEGDIAWEIRDDGTVSVEGNPQQVRDLIANARIPAVGKLRDGRLEFSSAYSNRIVAALRGDVRGTRGSRRGEVLQHELWTGGEKAGKIKGAPPEFDTPEKLPILHRFMIKAAQEGEAGRYWYENSGRAILRMLGGDRAAAEKFAKVLAVYSQSTGVQPNMTNALKAWYQWKAGLPIKAGRFGQQDRRVSDILYKDAHWEGEKTNNFFGNLMRSIDPEKYAEHQGVTNDLWMMRMFGYPTDAPTAQAYRFVETETNRLAQELGWEPQQVQAAIWTSIKARSENDTVKAMTDAQSVAAGDMKIKTDKKGKTVRKFKNDKAEARHRERWFQNAINAPITSEEIGSQKFDFADALAAHRAQVSWESRPGRLTGVLPEVNDAPFSEQWEFHQAIEAALLGPNGEDLLAQKMGVPALGEFQGPGVYQGEVTPGSQSELAVPPRHKPKGNERISLDEKTKQSISAYAAIKGALLYQEAMAWHRPFYAASLKDANGIEFNTGEPLLADDAKRLYTELSQELGASGLGIDIDAVGIIPSPSGARVIAFAPVDNRKFHAAVEAAWERASGDIDAAVKYFATDGDYISNDWSVSPNGEDYFKRAVEAGFQDAVTWAGDILAPKVRAVHEAFAEKYGWTNPAGKDGVGPAAQQAYQQKQAVTLYQSSKQTESAEFKKWFGGSKVVDEDGNPLVVYHGTDKAFTAFRRKKRGYSTKAESAKLGFWFVDNPTTAGGYAEYAAGSGVRDLYDKADRLESRGQYDAAEQLRANAENSPNDNLGANVKPVFLSIVNPMVIDFEGQSWADVEGWLSDDISQAIERGHDGVIIQNFMDDPTSTQPPQTHYVAFDPRQIKSAIGNSGAFSKRSADILRQGTPDSPRGFITFSPQKTLIGLLRADASTFVHETAHLWLRNFEEFVKTGQANEKHLADWATIQKWLGVKDGESMTVDQQEKFARGFEAYIREGIAPSEGLRGAFIRFSRWLSKLYRDFKDLRVELTDDVRQVMDRILATDEEIDFAHRQLGLDLFADIKGLDPKVKAKLTALRQEAKDQAFHELLQKQMAKLKERRQDELAAATERETERATKAVDAEPVYVAMEAVQRAFGEDPQRIAQEFVDGKLSKPDRLSFRMVSDLQGISSPQTLAKQILSVRSRQAEIDARVAEAIAPIIGESSIEQIKRDAVEIVHTEKAAELLSAERTFFRELIDQQQGNAQATATRREEAKVELAAIKRRASEIILQTPVRDAGSFMRYFTAERNAALEARDAAERGEFQKAADAKRRQLVNHELARASFKAMRAIQKWRSYLGQTQKKDKALFKREEHFSQVASILARFGIGRNDFDPELRTQTLQQWIDAMEANDEAASIAPWLADETIAKPFADLTVDEARDVVDAVKNIQRVANAQHSFYRIMGGAIVEDTVLEMAKTAAANNKARPAETLERKRSWFDGARRLISGYDAEIRTIENVAMKLDGWKEGGLFYRSLWRPVYEAANYESGLIKEYAAKLEELMKKHYSDEERRALVDYDDMVDIPEWKTSALKMSLLVAAMNTGNDSNRERLFGSRFVGIDPSVEWTEDSVIAVLQRNLTANDWRFVQGVWDLIESLWPMEVQVHKEATGFSPQKISSTPQTVVTPQGEAIAMRGGYFPLRADTRANLRAEVNEKLDNPLYTETNPAYKAVTKHGHLKSRVKGAAYPISLTHATIQQHLRDAIHDVAFRPVIIDLRRLVGNQAFADTVKTYASAEEYQALRDWVASVASGNSRERAALDTWERISASLRHKFGTAVIVFNPKIVTQNLSNIFLYAGSVDGFGWSDVLHGFLRHGILDYVPSSLVRSERAKAIERFVYEKSAWMRDKRETPEFTLRDIADRLLGKSAGLKQFFFGWMAATDQLTSIPVWMGAYDKAKADGSSEEEAVEFADNVIRRSIGAARRYETAPLFRGGELAKTMGVFQIFMNAQQNRWEREKGIVGRSPLSNSPRFAGYIASHFVLFAAASNLLSGNMPDWEDEEKLKKWIKSLLLYKFQMMPGVNAISSVVADYALGVPTFGYRPVPQAAVIERGLDTIRATIRLAKGEGQATNLIEQISHGLAYATGTPDYFVQMLWNIFDYWSEEMTPKPGDILRRRPRDERE